MKEITALDLHYLLKEWDLEKAKIDQIYQPTKDVLIRFHIPNQGKKIMRITKHSIFLTDFKEEQGLPKGFCMALRKHIKGARLRVIEQLGFERVLHLVLEKENEYHLFIELFGKGNIVLTTMQDDNYAVLASLNRLKEKTYTPPQKDINTKIISQSQFKQTLKEHDEQIVKVLAKTFGLAGFYAELLLESEDKKRLANDYSAKEAETLYEKVQSIFTKDPKPSLYNNRPIPFHVEGSEDIEKSFGEIVADNINKQLIEEQEKRDFAAYYREEEKILNIIKVQEETIKKLEAQADKNQRKGELIYEQYAKLRTLLDNLTKARENHSWEEIKEHLKDHELVKNVNTKNQTITVDL